MVHQQPQCVYTHSSSEESVAHQLIRRGQLRNFVTPAFQTVNQLLTEMRHRTRARQTFSHVKQRGSSSNISVGIIIIVISFLHLLLGSRPSAGVTDWRWGYQTESLLARHQKGTRTFVDSPSGDWYFLPSSSEPPNSPINYEYSTACNYFAACLVCSARSFAR